MREGEISVNFSVRGSPRRTSETGVIDGDHTGTITPQKV